MGNKGIKYQLTPFVVGTVTQDLLNNKFTFNIDIKSNEVIVAFESEDDIFFAVSKYALPNIQHLKLEGIHIPITNHSFVFSEYNKNMFYKKNSKDTIQKIPRWVWIGITKNKNTDIYLDALGRIIAPESFLKVLQSIDTKNTKRLIVTEITEQQKKTDETINPDANIFKIDKDGVNWKILIPLLILMALVVYLIII